MQSWRRLLQVEQLRTQWRAHHAAVQIREALDFEAEGLVLGAGTVLAKTDAGSTSSEDGDGRLEALFSVAYMRPLPRQALAHVKAAAARWREGDENLAGIHLALSRLGRLDQPDEAARRLFMIDGLMRAGVPAAAILDALDFAGSAAAPMRKYSPDQPRVPAGAGRTSGEWTTGGAGATTVAGPAPSTVAGNAAAPSTPPHPNAEIARPTVGRGHAERSAQRDARPRTANPASSPARAAPQTRPRGMAHTPVQAHAPGSVAVAGAIAAGRLGAGLDLGGMSEVAVAGLARFVTGLAASEGVATAIAATGAVAAVGVLVIPNPEPQAKWIYVGGPGDVSYRINPDETALHLRYTGADGVPRAMVASPGPDGDYRGPDGRVIARRLKAAATTGLVVSTAALLGGDEDKRNLCPAQVKDNGGELGTAYEDYAKARLNPENPTPHKIAYAYINAKTGEIVKIDDCDQKLDFPGSTKVQITKSIS
jgi:hypothetical protein